MRSAISLSGNCATIYGPVRSRRHGLSLGINLGEIGTKICTWGCVYCQCGHGVRADRPEESETLPEPQSVLKKLQEAIAANPDLDSVTIAGNSEPTTHPQFSDIVRDVLNLRNRAGGKWVFNCLSNGSELDRDRVRAACDALDEIWIKLDCGDEELFRKLNRPVQRIGTVADHVRRIALLKKPRVQTLLWLSAGNPALANFTETNVKALLEIYARLRPVEVHVTTVRRATAFEGLLPVADSELVGFANRVEKLGVICRAYP